MFLVVVGLVRGLERERGPGVPDLELKGLRRVWMRLFRTRMIWLVEQRRARNIRLTLCVGSTFSATLFMIGELCCQAVQPSCFIDQETGAQRLETACPGACS